MSTSSATDVAKMNGHPVTNGIHKHYHQEPPQKTWLSREAKIVMVGLFCVGVIMFTSYFFGEYMKLDPRLEIKFACCVGILLTTILALAVLENMTKICGGCYGCC